MDTEKEENIEIIEKRRTLENTKKNEKEKKVGHEYPVEGAVLFQQPGLHCSQLDI